MRESKIIRTLLFMLAIALLSNTVIAQVYTQDDYVVSVDNSMDGQTIYKLINPTNSIINLDKVTLQWSEKIGSVKNQKFTRNKSLSKNWLPNETIEFAVIGNPSIVRISNNTYGYEIDNVVCIDGFCLNKWAWYNATWLKRIKINISSGTVASDLDNFPVYINMTDLGATFFNNVKGDGSDIRVTLGDSQQVPREVVYLNNATYRGELYFKANLTTASDNIYYIYYDCSNCTKPANNSFNGVNNVWTNYEAVYHFSQNPSTSNLVDSTGNGHTGIPVGNFTSSSTLYDGVLGQSVSFKGGAVAGDTYDTGEFDEIEGQSQVTFSTWIKPVSFPSAERLYWSKRYTGGELGITTTPEIFFGIFSGTWTRATRPTPSTNTWHNIFTTYDSGSFTVSIDDGAEGTASGGVSTWPSTLFNATINGRNDNDAVRGGTVAFLTFNMTELRISLQLLSADWRQAENDNSFTPSAFYTAGSTENITGLPTFSLKTPADSATSTYGNSVIFKFGNSSLYPDESNPRLLIWQGGILFKNLSVTSYVPSEDSYSITAGYNYNIPSGVYQWNATIQQNSTGYVLYSDETRTITWNSNPPDAFNVYTPINGSYDGLDTITFTWDKPNQTNSANLASYYIYFLNIYNTTNLYRQYNTSGWNNISIAVPANQFAINNYTWNVVATNGDYAFNTTSNNNLTFERVRTSEQCLNYGICVDGFQNCTSTNTGVNTSAYGRVCTGISTQNTTIIYVLFVFSAFLLFLGTRIPIFGLLGSFVGIMLGFSIMWKWTLISLILIFVYGGLAFYYIAKGTR